MQQTADQEIKQNTPATRPKVTVPEWAVERWIGYVSRATSAIGKALDKLAKGPAPISWILRFFSSVWLGILWLFLIGVYVGVGSGMSWVRARLEMTDLQFFDAMPMRVLLVLLGTTLIVVTLRRITLSVYKLGVWTVHIGIITLLISCVIYFSQKEEGSVRIFLNTTVNHYFDSTERALYITMPGAKEPSMTGLPDLPIYYEHLPNTGNPLNETIKPEGVGDLSLRLTGYYPFANMSSEWGPGAADAPPDNPAVEFHLVSEGVPSQGRWLVANSPVQRVVDQQQMRFGIEYLYHPPAARLAEISAPFEGQAAITVRVPKLGVEKLYVVHPNVPIPVEGTPYIVTPQSVAAMPMLSKGYEGAFSTMLSVDVQRKDPDGKFFHFERQSMFRYPERSPDFVIENGKPVRKQNGVDPDIQIIFHDAMRDQFWIVEDNAGKLTFVQRAAGGKVTTRPLQVSTPLDITIEGLQPFQLAIDAKTPRAVKIYQPVIIPPAQRERNETAMDALAFSVLELEVRKGEWHSGKVYVPFVQFCATNPPYGQPPTELDVPGVGTVQLVLSTLKRPLPSTVTLEDFKPVKDEHTLRAYSNYISTLRVTDNKSGDTNTLVAQLNAPAEDHGLYYFQSAWDGNEDATADKRFSVIGVGNRPGITGMIVGALLIFVGIGYAFYIKPILLNIKKQQLAAAAADAGVI
jgi:hypothetical protein